MTDIDGINENCSCEKKNCPRHGNCRDCVEFHLGKGEKPPSCLRVKWTQYP